MTKYKLLLIMAAFALLNSGCAQVGALATGAVNKADDLTNGTLEAIGAPVVQAGLNWCALKEYRQIGLGTLVNGALAEHNMETLHNCDKENFKLILVPRDFEFTPSASTLGDLVR